MKPGPTYFKYSVLLICFIAGVFMFRGCKCNKEKIKQAPVVTIDTFWKKQDTFISYVPTPYKVSVPFKVEVPQNNDFLVLQAAEKDAIIDILSDSLKTMRDYLTTRYYYDSFKVQYGKVYARDTVQFNRLTGASIATLFSIPVVTKTVTIEARKRNVVLFGFSALGNKISPLYGTEFTLDLKNRNDRVYEAGALLLKGGDLYYKAGIRWPIRLTKK